MKSITCYNNNNIDFFLFGFIFHNTIAPKLDKPGQQQIDKKVTVLLTQPNAKGKEENKDEGVHL